ncbi:hypothetical protein [Pseudoflavonifractor sp. 524-17]|nr:hypothetical protein [Pseudoflavonifractor sp. 524-17]
MTITQMVQNQQIQRIGEISQRTQGKPFDTSILDSYQQGVDMRA